MATLTRLDRKVIAFKTVFEEQPFLDMFFMGAGVLFTCVGCTLLAKKDWMPLAQNAWLLFHPSWGMALLLLLGMILVGTAVWVYSFVNVFKSERLRIDLRRRTYKCRRGLLFWAERFRGSLDEFDHIQVAQVPYDDGSGCLCWSVQFVWREDRHRPFRVDYWKRARSFTLKRACRNSERVRVLRALRDISKSMQVPLIPPPKYVDGAELAEVEDDFWASGKEKARDLAVEV